MFVFFPFHPFLPGGFRKKITCGEPLFPCKLGGTIPNEDDVGGFLHNLAGHGYSVDIPFETHHGPTIAHGIHDAGIQGHMTIPVRPPPEPYGLVAGVSLFYHYPGFDGIQSSPAFL